MEEYATDRGWAWVILASAFFHCFVCSIIFTTGIFNVVFLEWFGETRAKTSMIAAVPLSLICFAAPFVSLLNQYIGPRKTVLLGALCIFSGFTITAYVQSFEAVFFTYGIMVGVGFALIYTPSLVVVGFYFKRYRNIAYGIINTGLGSGSIVFAVIIESLIEYYGTRATMLMLAAICSHCFITGALIRPHKTQHAAHIEVVKAECNNKDGIKYDVPSDIYENGVNKLYGNDHSSSILEKGIKSYDYTAMTLNEDTQMKFKSYGNEEILINTNVNDLKCNADPFYSKEEPSVLVCKESTTDCKKSQTKHSQRLKFILSVPFLLLNFNLLLADIGLACVYIHFPAYILSFNNVGMSLPPLYLAMGIGNIVCRLLAGIITNGSQTRTFYTYITSCLLAGITSLTGPYICKHYVGQIIFAFFFAFFGNTFIGLLCPVLIDLFGLTNLNLALGIGFGTSGFGLLVGPPLAGWLYDVSESYYYTFVLSGVCYIISGLVLFMIPIVKIIQSHD